MNTHVVENDDGTLSMHFSSTLTKMLKNQAKRYNWSSVGDYIYHVAIPVPDAICIAEEMEKQNLSVLFDVNRIKWIVEADGVVIREFQSAYEMERWFHEEYMADHS